MTIIDTAVSALFAEDVEGASMEEQERHYKGQAIVGPDNLFRRLPKFLDPAQRMRFDAITFASDATEHAWLSLRHIAATVAIDFDALRKTPRVALFSSAWAIVNNLDSIRQLIASVVPTPGPVTGAMLESLAPVQTLRNKFAHLNGNIPNAVNAKGAGFPLFGCLGYFYSTGPQMGHSIVVRSGLAHRNENWPIVNPSGRTVLPPADHFTLSAFEISLEFGPILHQLAEWVTIVSEPMEKNLISEASAYVEKHGASFDELMAPLAHPCFSSLEMSFGEDGDPA